MRALHCIALIHNFNGESLLQQLILLEKIWWKSGFECSYFRFWWWTSSPVLSALLQFLHPSLWVILMNRWMEEKKKKGGGGEGWGHASLLRRYNTVNLTSCPLSIMLFSLLSTFQPALPQSRPSHCLSFIIMSSYLPCLLRWCYQSVHRSVWPSVWPSISTNNYWPVCR